MGALVSCIPSMLFTLTGPPWVRKSLILSGLMDLFLCWKMVAPDLEAFSACLFVLSGEKILSDLLDASPLAQERVERGAKEWMSS